MHWYYIKVNDVGESLSSINNLILLFLSIEKLIFEAFSLILLGRNVQIRRLHCLLTKFQISHLTWLGTRITIHDIKCKYVITNVLTFAGNRHYIMVFMNDLWFHIL